ncbi:glycosyltransferase family 2 protein [Rhizobium laguerreae]|uniref:glycosyltransferase family 2 protein n=1 Tax=Rhizobium laguerreae TaxID=1076926 RepID=UPI001C917F3A|nr:glycosyltransferase [Rhizobium laguerreae]MBY3167864.1 glycosyltransferase [Rhizobium laguerreae]UFW64883.1 glycosyltransferase [Rhizobium laguerreae]
MTAETGCLPTVSVIIPTYNRARFIREAIESVFSQTYRDFELIVIDDGSTDETAKIVRALVDNRLNFIRQENRGRSAARNRAIALARGRYIAFLDSDDMYLPDKLAQQVDYMDSHPEDGMIYTSAMCIDGDGNPLNSQRYEAWADGEIYKQVAFFQPVTITLPTVMVRREVLNAVGGFDEAMDRFEDTDLWRRIAKHYRVGILVEATCILRTHGDNTLRSQDPAKIIEAIEYYVAKIFREDADVGMHFLKNGASRLYGYYGRAFMSVPGWRHQGALLTKRSIALEPKRTAEIVASTVRTVLGSAVRRIFTKMS